MHDVMIVEDDVMYRYAIRTSVEWEKEGFRICGEAINGKHALSLLNECRPRIVITDIDMPEMSGIDLIAALQQLDPLIYIVVLSSYGDYPFVREALKSGAKDYFLKHDMDPDDWIRILNDYKQYKSKQERHKDGGAPSIPLPELVGAGGRSFEVQQIVDYIKQHYHEQISLHQLSEQLFLSPNYLCNIFKQNTGMTIFEYIKQFRIELTKHLLDATSLRVYEIAEQVGFKNSSYLCRVFKEVTGTNINEYKRHPH